MEKDKPKTFGELTDDDSVYVVYKLEIPRVLKLNSYYIINKKNNNRDIKITGIEDKSNYIENGNTLVVYETDRYIVTTDKEYIYPYIYRTIENYLNKIRSNISKIRTLNYENETFCDVIDQLIKMLK
jgi:hypothetical protein